MAITDYYVTSDGSADWGDATSDSTPCSLATAISNVAAGDRVNIKADATYTLSGDITFSAAGSNTQPIIWRGYSSTIGDGYQGRSSDGTLDDSNMPLIDGGSSYKLTVSGANQIVDSLSLTNTENSHTVYCSGVSIACCHCVIGKTGTGGSAAYGIYVAGAYSAVVDCDISAASSTCHSACVAAYDFQSVIGCRITCPNGNGVRIIRRGWSVVGNLIHGSTVGIALESTYGHAGCIVGNTIVDNSGNGIDQNNTLADDLVHVAGNLITDNGGYGIDNNYSTALPHLLMLNRFDRNTGGALNGVADWQNMEAETTSKTQGEEYTDAASDDYTLASTSPAIDAGPLPSSNIGYWQNAAAAAGGVFIMPSRPNSLVGR